MILSNIFKIVIYADSAFLCLSGIVTQFWVLLSVALLMKLAVEAGNIIRISDIYLDSAVSRNVHIIVIGMDSKNFRLNSSGDNIMSPGISSNVHNNNF